MSADRILIISHAHPDMSRGGGEIAAYAQWQELRRQGIEALFLARSAASSGHVGTPFSARSADAREVLFHAPPVEHFLHSQRDRRVVCQDFRNFLEHFRPSAVHFHHYVHLGLELVREVRRYSNEIPIVMTLHDYLGICHAQGQMRKTSGLLCERASPMDCHGCFPEKSPQDFFLRELFVKSFFTLVDQFVCPSQFLRDRYVAWGLPAERMVVLENGIAFDPPTSQQDALGAAGSLVGPLDTDAPRVRFVALGQVSDFKGTEVLLDAARALPKSLRRDIRIELHGSSEQAGAKLRRQVELATRNLSPLLRYCGPYLHSNVGAILRAADWLIVPSIWWENAPLVIQEAFAAGRPVLCSNIGGMAEKVVHGRNGLHFIVGSAGDLARKIEEAATTPGLWQRLRGGIGRPTAVEETVKRQLALYRAIQAVAPSSSAALHAVAAGAAQ